METRAALLQGELRVPRVPEYEVGADAATGELQILRYGRPVIWLENFSQEEAELLAEKLNLRKGL